MPRDDSEIKGRGGLDHAGIRRRLDRVESNDLYDGHRRVVHDDRGPYTVSVPPLVDVDARPDDFRDFVEWSASDPFTAGRAAELSADGYDPDLSFWGCFVATWKAATRRETKRRVQERGSLKPLRNRVDEEAEDMVRGSSDRATPVATDVLDAKPDPAGRRDVVKMLTDAEEARIRTRADLTAAEETVWVAYYYDELKPREIAERRGTAPGTVRVQLSRARSKMKTGYRAVVGEPVV